MRAETVFKAIGDETRLRAFGLLQQQELSVTELVEVLALPQSTVSRHLKVLREAGLVRDRRDGVHNLYAASRPGSNGTDAELLQTLTEWVGRQETSAELQQRLRAVLDQRQQMSRQFFDRVGRHWDKLREESFGPTFHLEAMLALLPQSWTVGDIGTGTGYLLPTLAGHFTRVIAVEPVEQMLSSARQRVKGENLTNVELRCGDLTALPMDAAAVDLALALLVLHHVPVPEEALQELHRIVKPQGRVLIVEQSAHQFEAFRERMQDRWWGFDPPTLMEKLDRAGFTEIETRKLGTVQRTPETPDLFVVTARRG